MVVGHVESVQAHTERRRIAFTRRGHNKRNTAGNSTPKAGLEPARFTSYAGLSIGVGAALAAADAPPLPLEKAADLGDGRVHLAAAFFGFLALVAGTLVFTASTAWRSIAGRAGGS